MKEKLTLPCIIVSNVLLSIAICFVILGDKLGADDSLVQIITFVIIALCIFAGGFIFGVTIKGDYRKSDLNKNDETNENSQQAKPNEPAKAKSNFLEPQKTSKTNNPEVVTPKEISEIVKKPIKLEANKEKSPQPPTQPKNNKMNEQQKPADAKGLQIKYNLKEQGGNNNQSIEETQQKVEEQDSGDKATKNKAEKRSKHNKQRQSGKVEEASGNSQTKPLDETVNDSKTHVYPIEDRLPEIDNLFMAFYKLQYDEKNAESIFNERKDIFNKIRKIFDEYKKQRESSKEEYINKPANPIENYLPAIYEFLDYADSIKYDIARKEGCFQNQKNALDDIGIQISNYRN